MGIFDRVGLPERPEPTPIKTVQSGIKTAGIGDKTALNDRLNDPANWKGTDDDNWLMRWRIYIKHWFAFSNKSPQGITASFLFFPLMWFFPLTVWFTGFSWWYLFPIAIIPVARKWRKKPKVIWGRKWGGYWRWEHTGDLADDFTATDDARIHDVDESDYYLSRIQPWCRASIIIFWPLCIVGHFYQDRFDVGTVGGPKPEEKAEIYFYRGWHFDKDLIFWGDGAAGPNFK